MNCLPIKVNYRHLGKVCNGWPADADNWVISKSHFEWFYHYLFWNCLQASLYYFELGRWVHEVYKFQDNYFFITCQIRKPEIGIWVWILGSETEAKRFRVSFKLGDAVNPSSKLKSVNIPKQCFNIQKKFQPNQVIVFCSRKHENRSL